MKFAVIGATQGLGLCLTQQLLEGGHQVAAIALVLSEELNQLAQRYPQQVRLIQGDVTDEAQMNRAAQEAQEFLGQLDALCNVAGVLLSQDRVKLLHQCDIGELRKTLDVNTVGPVIVAKAFLPWIKKGGRIFTVTSEGVGIKSCGTWVPCYALSKAAATKETGIFNASTEDADFYAVHPGRMNTEMGRTTAQIEPEESAAGFCRLMTGEVPLSRDHWYIDYLGREMEA